MRLFLLAVSLVLAVTAIPAHADDLFTLTSGDTVITFVEPTTIDFSSYNRQLSSLIGFDTFPTVTIGSTTTYETEVGFYFSGPSPTGLDISYGYDILDQSTTAQLFTDNVSGLGILDSITFNLGDYAGTSVDRTLVEEDVYPGNFDIDITQYVAPPSPTPEPSSLILLGTGLIGLTGAFAHRLKPFPSSASHSSPVANS